MQKVFIVFFSQNQSINQSIKTWVHLTFNLYLSNEFKNKKSSFHFNPPSSIFKFDHVFRSKMQELLRCLILKVNVRTDLEMKKAKLEKTTIICRYKGISVITLHSIAVIQLHELPHQLRSYDVSFIKRSGRQGSNCISYFF